MKKLIIVTFLIASVAVHSAQAMLINGEIFFSSTSSNTFTPGGSTPATATGISFGTAAVDMGLGDYFGLAGTPATFKDFTFGPVGTTGVNSVVSLWTLSVPGPITYSFELTHITVNALAGSQRNLEGTGIAKIDDGLGTYDDTEAQWSMNFSGSSTIVSFSSATRVPVPDSGATTLVLLGIGLLGLLGATRQFKK